MNDFKKAFLAAKQSEQNKVALHLDYVDINDGYLHDAVLFSQIMYWHLPNKKGVSKLRVKHDGHYWIAKKHGDWWEECRIKDNMVRKALKRIEERKLIHYTVKGFGGKKIPHIRINWEGFQKAITAQYDTLYQGTVLQCIESNTETTSTETTKEKDLSASKSAEGVSDSSKDTCAKCGGITHTVIDREDKPHKVCLCTVKDQPIVTMSKSQLEKLKVDIEAPLVTGAGLLEDHNLPGTTVTPLCDVPPGNTINKAYFDKDRRRIVTTTESEPAIAETPEQAPEPANIEAETVEVAQVMPSPEPETVEEKPKEKPLTPHQEMQQVIIHAMGWKQENVKEWGQINKTSKKLRDTNTNPDMIMGWRTWNNQKFSPMKNPYAIVSTWADYMEWRENQTFPTWEQVKAEKLRTDIPSIEVEIPEDERVSPEEIAATMELAKQLARKKTIGYDPITDTLPNER